MAKIPKTNVRKKTTKNIDKQRVVEIMRANINPKTNNPNYSKVSNLTGYDRKTLASWWSKRASGGGLLCEWFYFKSESYTNFTRVSAI